MQQHPDPNIWTSKKMKGIPASLGEIYTQKGADGLWKYGFQLSEEHCNAQGFAHGGILMTAMDHGLALVIWEAVDRAFCSTVHLDNHFINAFKPPGFLELRTHIIRQTQHLVYASGELWSDHCMIMLSSGVWHVKRANN